ncbi:MAG: exo-alpha-sialidase, partial [Pirellulaceae bacterium]
KRVHPVLIRNDHNALLSVTVTTDKPFVQLEAITVSLSGCDDLQDLDSLQFVLGAGDGRFDTTVAFGDRLPAARKMTFRGHARLNKGANVFWLSCRLRSGANLSNKVDGVVTRVQTNAGEVSATPAAGAGPKRIGVALRRHWDDGVHTYRIPALATTTEGTLLCVYDMRRRKGKDLQEDIDIGLMRSTDGGKTWDPQRVIMDMGTYGGFGQEINGVSDPGIIVDPASGEIFCFGVWMVGKAGKHQWVEDGSEKGFEIGKSAQMLMIRSKDDGKSWSKPKNMTRTWKKKDWILYAPSPQQGIALRDGTLVMPTQGRDEDDENFSNLLVSKDHGATWKVSAAASLGNSECQAVELRDGSIMLNMRTERSGVFARTVAVTKDLGRTWRPHSTNRKALIEPHCNGSLYRFDYVVKGKKTSLLLFANPHSTSGRHHHSIQVSMDDGKTWPAKYRLLLDEGSGAGYPSLSRVDDNHVGIVYEGSQSHVVFEKIAISELLER